MTPIETIKDMLAKVGVPDILERPEDLAQLDDDAIAILAGAHDMAVDASEDDPTNEELLDLFYLSHMALTQVFFLRSVMVAGEPVEAPPAADLKRMWNGEPLRPVAKEAIAEMLVPTATLETLTSAGLPEGADPNLEFDEAPVRLIEAEGMDSEDADPDYVQYFQAYWAIGATENDDVIAIDERGDGLVVVLDREFGLFAMQYMNASVAHLLVTMQAFGDLLDAVDDAAVNADPAGDIPVPVEAVERFRNLIEALDPGAMSEGAFWYEELAMITDGEAGDDDGDDEGTDAA